MGKPTERAVIEIKRKDQSMPIVWEVYRKEFDKQQSSWKTMPTFMLKKVAIAQGFRLAFPEEVGGMPYIPEELPSTNGVTSETLNTVHREDTQVEEVPPETNVPSQEAIVEDEPKYISEAQRKRFYAIAKGSGKTDEQIKDYLVAMIGTDSTKMIPKSKYEYLCNDVVAA